MLAYIMVHACTSEFRQLICLIVHTHIIDQECEYVLSAFMDQCLQEDDDRVYPDLTICPLFARLLTQHAVTW